MIDTRTKTKKKETLTSDDLFFPLFFFFIIIIYIFLILLRSYVQQLQKSAQAGPKQSANPEESRKAKKKLEEEQAKELASLFAVAVKQPKLQPGVDPKSVVCEFYRAGQCTKGFKCKYSHDLSVERKKTKIDLFSDRREGEGGEEEDGMEDWDQGEAFF